MKKQLQPVMFVGTGSDVGKSVINAAFCRIFRQDGYSPAPFKAQNMSLNSYATAQGHEMGRAQVVQAEACQIPPHVEMNPVLLKPTTNQSSQVIVNGKVIGNQTAKEYFMETDRDLLFKEVMKSYSNLSQRYSPIVIEGAGSISEINLWKKDITNMRVALATTASTFLIADIDKGGIFASVFGTLELLPKEERKLIQGIILNKFRGDISLFDEGKTMLEDITGVPVVAIIPYFRDIYIEDEDSVVLDKKLKSTQKNKINIAVVLLKQMSNFTDFNILERIPGVNLHYTNSEEDVLTADIIIIPGSKSTIADLMFLRETGIAKAILTAHENGTPVYGICGGFQMMGTQINDPENIEGAINSIPGLGILPVSTTITDKKTTEQCTFSFLSNAEHCKGYEIHMGETVSTSISPVCKLSNGKNDGYFLNSKTWGTYIHGIFDNISIINSILGELGSETQKEFNIADYKEEQYNKLAQLVRDNSDMDYIYKSLAKTQSEN